MKINLNRISFKLLVVCLSFTLPIAVMLSLMTKAKQKDIDFAQWEMKGNKYQRPLENLLQSVTMHRWIELQSKLGESISSAEQEEISTDMKKALEDLKVADSQVGAALQFDVEGLSKRQRQDFTVKNLEDKITQLQSDRKNWTIEESEKNHKDIVAHIKTMITHAGDTSNLILDPDLDSYYLMDVTLLALPQIEDRLGEIISFVERMKKKGKLDQSERIQASVYSSFLKEADLDRINASSQTSLNEDANFYGATPSLQTNLARVMKFNSEAVAPIIESLKVISASENLDAFDMSAFRDVTRKAIDSIYQYQRVGFEELDVLLAKRSQVFEASVRDAILWTAISLFISSLLAFAIARNLITRIRKFNETTKVVAAGDFSARVKMNSKDEIGELANSFDVMTDRVGALNSEIASKNDELKEINGNLEKIVQERTATIKTILDNVKFGFVLIDNKLNVQDGFSKSCGELLGEGLKSGVSFLKAIGISDTRQAPMYEELLNQTFADELPEEMTLHQLPSRIQLGEKIISIIAAPVRNNAGKVSSLLFTLIDATNLEKMEKENHRHKVLVRLLKEIDSFKDFLDETKTRIGLCRKFVENGEQGKVRAELHTIKGNTAAYDMIDIAKIVHHIEDGIKVTISDIDRIESSFVAFLEANFDVLQLQWATESVEKFSISKDEIENIINRVKASAGADINAIAELTKWATTIQYKSARSLVGALPDYGERLALRMGKPCKIRLEGGDVKMDPEIMRPIMQSLVHFVRNSIDHGIELPYLRGNKPEEGMIQIACSEFSNGWSIDFSDDGIGIDAEKLVAKAIKNGSLTPESALSMTRSEKLKLVFVNGVSTSEEVSDISGRGVGMGAVEAAVLEAGGSLEVDSKENVGTRISINIPRTNNNRRAHVKKAA